MEDLGLARGQAERALDGGGRGVGDRPGAVDYTTKPLQHEEALARIRTHLTLRRLQRELQEQLALKERFIRIAGHDLRNPLCLILVSGELARRQGAAPEILEYLESIHASARQMRSIIDTFLNLRRPGLESAGASARCDARCDAGLAYQAIANYVSNALKFTPPGGRVDVQVRESGLRLRVEVADTGPGVPPAERGALFTEGARLSPRPTGGEESNGVGLSIVKQLVEAQGGTVGADFPGATGARFWLELPVAGA